MVNQREQNRIQYLDVLRCVACLAVVMIHVSMSFTDATYFSVDFWIGNVLESVSRVGVPLFVMISGALLLDERHYFSEKKNVSRILKMAGFYFSWSLFYCILLASFSIMKGNGVPKFRDLMAQFVKGYYHLWFIYLIIGIYIILPFLRLWVNKKNSNMVFRFICIAFVYYFFVSYCFQILDAFGVDIEMAQTALPLFNLQYFGGYTAYFILGWYLHNFEIPKKWRRLIYCVGMAGLAFTIYMTFFCYVKTGNNQLFYNNFGLNIFVQSVAIYVLIYHLVEKDGTKEYKFCIFISKYSLGIYAIHPAVKAILTYILQGADMGNAFTKLLLVYFSTLICSICIIWMAKRIPLIKKIV